MACHCGGSCSACKAKAKRKPVARGRCKGGVCKAPRRTVTKKTTIGRTIPRWYPEVERIRKEYAATKKLLDDKHKREQTELKNRMEKLISNAKNSKSGSEAMFAPIAAPPSKPKPKHTPPNRALPSIPKDLLEFPSIPQPQFGSIGASGSFGNWKA